MVEEKGMMDAGKGRLRSFAVHFSPCSPFLRKEAAAQCDLLDVCRAQVYRQSKAPCEEDLELMRWMDEVSLEDPVTEARRVLRVNHAGKLCSK